MSATDSRCVVCNSESMGNMFCSQQCEDEYNEVSERLWEINQNDEPPYLDDYSTGPKKFRQMCDEQDDELSLDECQELIRKYRE